ncbi:MAG: PAS domain S-box protein [Chloroflexi bacterium]|nr:PAS domain S-box protein [Chloroflexota bacterium]
MTDPLLRRMEEVQAEIGRLLTDVGETPHNPLLASALEQLGVSLEELHVATEEMRQQQDALVESRDETETERRRYRELFYGAPEPYIVTDVDGRIRAANSAAAALLRVPVDRLLGKPLRVYVEPDDRRTFSLLLARLRSHDRVDGSHLRLRPRDGERPPVWVQASAMAVFPRQGEEGRSLRWVLHDVTDERAMEERLAQERDILTTIMENTSAQLAYLDRDFRFVRVNAAYADGSGHAVEDLLGRDHFDVFPNEENEEIFRRVRDTGEAVRFAARPFQYADQPERGVTYWDWSLVPVKDAAGEVTGLVFSLLDVTEMERGRQAREGYLSALQQMLDVSQSVLAERTAEGLLRETVSAARRLTGARAAFVCRWGDADNAEIVAEDLSGAAGSSVDPGPTVVAVCNRLAAHSRAATARQPGAGAPRGRGVVGARLLLGEGQAGAVVAVDKVDGAFSAEDEALLGQLASLATLGMAHIRATRGAERRAEEREAVFGALTNAVFVYDASGEIAHCNSAAREALGYSPVGRSRRVIVSQIALRLVDSAPVPFDQLPSSRALRGETVRGERYQYNGPHGAVLTLLISAAPFVMDGQVAGAVVVWHDVTEREQLLEALRAEQARLRAVIDNAPVGIVFADAQGDIVLVNRAAEQAFDQPLPYAQPVAEALGAHLTPLGSAAPVGRDHPLVRAALHGETVQAEELVLRVPGGRERRLLHHAAPVRLSPTGGLDGAVLAFQDITEMRRAEETLHRRQEEFRALVENAPDIVARYDSDLRYTYVNPVVERYIGASPEDLVGKSMADLGLDAGLAARLEGAVAEVFGSGSEQTLEYALPVGSERFHMEARLSPEFSADGTVHSVLCVTRDITERHRAREALGRYAMRLQVLHLLDRAILAARSVDDIAHAALESVRDIIPYRRSSVMIFDRPANEFTLYAQVLSGPVAGELQELQEGARLPLDSLWYRDVLERGETYISDDLQQVEAGSSLLGELQAVGIRAYASLPLITQGEVIGALTLGMSEPASLAGEALDVGQEVADELAIGVRQAQLDAQVRRHAQALEMTVARRTAALRESEERFRAVYEEAGIGIAIVDEEGIIRDANPALRQMLGYPSTGLVGRSLALFEYRDEGTGEPDPEMYRRLVRDGSRHAREEKQYRRQDGRRVWVDQIITFVHPVNRRAPFAVVLLDDITERKQMLATMAQNERLVMSGRMAATVAHEINNPLQAVIGCLGLARELVADDNPDAIRYLDVGREELLRTARIVSRLRDVHRPFRVEDREPTDLNALLEQSLEMILRRREDQGVTLTVDTEPLPAARMVPDRVQQVVISLLLNALDAMPEGGQLTLRTRSIEAPAGVRLDVIDTGRGIPVERLPFVFDMFYTSKVDGLGLGLYLSQGIVDEHGGHLELQSEEGRGTSVSVWLPR